MKHLKWLVVGILATAQLCQASAPMESTVGRLMVQYYGVQLYAHEMQHSNATNEIKILQAKVLFVQYLDRTVSCSHMLSDRMGASLSAQENAFAHELLSGSAGGQALKWIDIKFFSGLHSSSILSILTAPDHIPEPEIILQGISLW